LWVVALDRRSLRANWNLVFPSVTRIRATGDLFFQAQEGGSRISTVARSTVAANKGVGQSGGTLRDGSADGKWAVAEAPTGDQEAPRGFSPTASTMEGRNVSAITVPRQVDRGWKIPVLRIAWWRRVSRNYKTFVVPLHPGESFPDLPAAGIKSESDLAHVRGVKVVDDLIHPGPDVSTTLSTARRSTEIYRIPIR